MRKLTFIIAILGIFFILILSLFIKPVTLNSPSDLNKTLNKQKVFVQGTVIQQFFSNSKTFLKLNNGFSLKCACHNNINYKNKNISVIGIINEFPIGNKQIDVLKIKINDY